MANDIVAFEQRLEAEKDSILARLPKLNDWLTPERWYSVVRDLVRRGQFLPVIQQNPDSLIDALKDLAVWGVEPDGQEAFINVRTIDNRKTAMAQIMWKGLIRRGVEAGVIAHAVPDVIREGDTIEELVDFKGRHLKHVRAKGANRKIIGSYALFWLPNGLMDYELLDEDDIAACLRASQRSAGGKTTPAWQYTPGEQAKKSAINRGMKRMRGKRDAAFTAMMDAQNRHFDAETTGELQDDELPQPGSDMPPKPEVSSISSESGPAAALDVEDVEGGDSAAPGVDAVDRGSEAVTGVREKPAGAASDALLDDAERAMLKELKDRKAAQSGKALLVLRVIKECAPESGGFIEKVQRKHLDSVAEALERL